MTTNHKTYHAKKRKFKLNEVTSHVIPTNLSYYIQNQKQTIDINLK